jgi:hypothetical protein
MLNLVLKRGGLLEAKHSRWLPKQKKYTSKTEDVSDIAICYLYEPIEMGEDVRLGDLLSLLQKCPMLSEFVFRREWARELMDEVKDAEFKPYTGEYDPDGIEYLELYKHIEFNSKTREYSGFHRWDLHGIGFELREDQPEDYGHKKGERVNWSLSFQSPIDLWKIPLKVRTDARVFESDLDSKQVFREIDAIKLERPTLGDLIQGVLWELGFHGPKESREKEMSTIKERVKEVEDGTAKLIPLDEVIEKLKTKALERINKAKTRKKSLKTKSVKKAKTKTTTKKAKKPKNR